MNLQDYQGLAMRTSPEGHDRILNGCLGLVGETGEIVDILKKWRFQSGGLMSFPKEKLIEECGDVLWYCAELATGLEEDLAAIYNKASFEFDDMRELNEEAPAEIFADRIAVAASRPFLTQDKPSTKNEIWIAVRKAELKADIIGILSMIRDFLEIHCSSSLSDAMERNIEKLRKRYPEGFDPERSLHRNEETHE